MLVIIFFNRKKKEYLDCSLNTKNSLVCSLDYPNRPSSSVALYCEGISIRAERANSVCFLVSFTFFDIISVKFTN